MVSIQLNSHISGRFEKELENLKNSVLTMGGLVEKQLSDTLVALKENNHSLAEKVVINDVSVNTMEIQIDEECMRIIAKRHPTASDLRLVMTASKATSDIERIGDEIERIARLISKGHLPDSADIRAGMLVMGTHVKDMLHAALDAFARQDANAAVEVHEQDKEIDAKYRDILHQTMLEMQKHASEVQLWLELLWALRAFERIGDRCKNICEYVMYLTHGTDMRHSSVESLQAKLR